MPVRFWLLPLHCWSFVSIAKPQAQLHYGAIGGKYEPASPKGFIPNLFPGRSGALWARHHYQPARRQFGLRRHSEVEHDYNSFRCLEA
jgi:hypothetical protein